MTGGTTASLGSGFNADPTGALSSSELYDPSTEMWTTTGDMAVPFVPVPFPALQRFYHVATLLSSGKVLVVGGSGGPQSPETGITAEVYDQATGNWVATHNLNHFFLEGHTATLLPSGKVLVAAGTGDIPPELYDPATGMWTDTGSMLAFRCFPRRRCCTRAKYWWREETSAVAPRSCMIRLLGRGRQLAACLFNTTLPQRRCCPPARCC